MEARQQAEQQQAIREAMAAQRAALERDPGDPTIGNPDGDVTIVEFFDYQCGYCKSVMEPLMELVAKDGNIRLVLKEFPILGPASQVAARASLAAAKQGKYDVFHLDLMRLRGRLTEGAIYQVAREAGLDLDILKADMASPAIQAQIQKTYQLAQALQIQGTPAFTIGERLIPGAISQEQMVELVAKVRQGG
ncbi:MAG: DsbA family protein [Alphaproteobacteria bacterium]|nr:DsbA family protein [Alphaproteobacteria bacterium]